MDGGAYCTLTPVVLSRGALHAGGPYRCPNVRIRGRATRTNTPPNGAFRGFGAPQAEFAAEMQIEPHRRGARGSARSRCGAGTSTGSGDTTPTGQVLRDSVAAEEVLERAAEAAEFERIRERPAATAARAAAPGRPGRPLRTATRTARASGSRWPGTAPGSPARARSSSPRVASVELDRRRRIRVLTALDRDGPGDEDDLSAARRRRSSACRRRGRDTRRRTPPIVPDSGPTVASRTAMVVGGLRILAARQLRAAGRGRRRRPFADVYRDDAARPRRDPHRPAVRALPGRPLRRRDVPRRRLPGVRLGGLVATVEVDLDTAEVRRPRRRRRRRCRAGHPPDAVPRARSRAARSRPSATRRSRRSSCRTGATSTTAWRRTSSQGRHAGHRSRVANRRGGVCRAAGRNESGGRHRSRGKTATRDPVVGATFGQSDHGEFWGCGMSHRRADCC